MNSTENTSTTVDFPNLYSIKLGVLGFASILATLGSCIARALGKNAPLLSLALIALVALTIVAILCVCLLNFLSRFIWVMSIGKIAFPWKLNKRVASAPQDFVTHVRGYNRFGTAAPAPAVVLEHKPTKERSAILFGNRSAIRILEDAGVQKVYYYK